MPNRSLPLIVTIGVALATPVRADGDAYGRARHLVQRADALFALHRDDDALSLLQQVLAMQRQGRREYGYARYARYARARYHHREGRTAQAKAELIKALQITARQDRVDPLHRVTQRDAFIVANFPRLAGVSVRELPAHRLVPEGTRLVATKSHVYALGASTLHRIDPRRRTVLALYHADAPIARLAVLADDRQLVLVPNDSRKLHWIRLDPLSERDFSLPTNPERLLLASDGRAVTFLARNEPYGLQAYHMDLTTGRPQARRLFDVKGQLLAADDKTVLYAPYAFDKGQRFDPQTAPRYASIVARKLFRSASETIFRFPKIDHRNRIFTVEGKKHVVLFVRDSARNERQLIVYDRANGQAKQHQHKTILLFPAEPAAALSHAEDYLVLLERRGGHLHLVRFDIGTGQSRDLALLPNPAPGHQGPIHALGVAADNRTIWIHRGSELVLVNEKGKSRTSSLIRLARAPKPRWTGQTYYFAAHDQFYLGIDPKKAGPYFMMVRRSSLAAP